MQNTAMIMKTATRKKLSKPKIQRVGLAGLKRELAALEKKYKMPTEIFLQKVESGELSESNDFIDWLGLAEAYRNITGGKSHDNREIF